MILLISEDPAEEMSLALYDYLSDKTDVEIIKNTTFPFNNRFTLYPDKGKLKGVVEINGRRTEMSEIKAIYTRMTECEPGGKFSEKSRREISAERLIAINAIFEIADAMVINKGQSQVLNSSKLFQSYIIEKYGFKIPNSIISNNREKVEKFIKKYKKDGIIYKSASAERSKVQRFKDEDFDKLDLIKNSPHLFQQCVKGRDIRVHALATGETFACIINTETSDYRYDSERRIKPCDLPRKIREQCVKMTLDMGLYLSGIDLRVNDNGDYYCFEVNPSPAFYWYEKQTGLPITKATGDMMMKSEKYKGLAIRKY